ncbi:tetratricopeptide repeat protein [Thermodesulfobacteriota bacterium]
MAKKKRITRKELLKEPDEFYTHSSILFRYILEHKKEFIYGLCAVFALAVIISGIRFFSNRAETKAFAMLDLAVVKYQALAQKKDLKEALKEAEADFEKIVDIYSGKEGGKIARLTYANICQRAGEFDKAITLYNRSLKDFKDEPFIKRLTIKGLAYSHEAKKDYQTAIQYFDMLASGSDADPKDEILFHLGVIYAEMGDAQKSKEAFDKIIANYPGSMYVEMIKEMT